MTEFDGAGRSRRIRERTWAVLVALALLVGLATGAFALYDRFTKGTPTFTGDLSGAAGARAFVAFAHANRETTVNLDLSCTDDGAKSTCLAEPGVRAAEIFLWAFTSGRCFNHSADPGIDGCSGGNVFVIGSTLGTSAFVGNGASGAGSIVVRGAFHLLDTGPGGSIFPSNIQTFRLNPVSG